MLHYAGWNYPPCLCDQTCAILNDMSIFAVSDDASCVSCAS